MAFASSVDLESVFGNGDTWVDLWGAIDAM